MRWIGLLLVAACAHKSAPPPRANADQCAPRPGESAVDYVLCSPPGPDAGH